MWNRIIKIVVLLLVLYVVYAEAQSPTQFAQKHNTKTRLQHSESTHHVAKTKHGSTTHHHKHTQKKKRHRNLRVLRAHLNEKQRRRFFFVMRKGRSVSKKIHKSKLNGFVRKLLPKQQKKIKMARQKAMAAQKKQERWTANKLKKLSPDAQALFTMLNVIAQDESITKPVEQKRIKDTLKKANKKTIRELKKAKIKLPGVPPRRPKRHGKSKKNKKSKAKQHKKKPSKSRKKQQKKKQLFKPTGYIATLYRKLTKDDQNSLRKILVQRNLKKREYKKKIESFVHKLKPNLQKTFKDAKSKYDTQMKKDAATVNEKMSDDAKKLFKKILKIQRNGQITFDQEHKQISALIKQTDEKILDEFRNNNVHLFGLKEKPKSEADTKTGTKEKVTDKKDNDKKTTTDEEPETKEGAKIET
ncbi:hypothetical protein M3Y98_00840300 [Aphelenchoides besseyi]|nr:hypothetical protein M3Y98_00840300 [Aphelenchoides besseyi]KAI6195508.1 hypothetical protein M3Y96_01238800 [Aphelenchoides besseyi]